MLTTLILLLVIVALPLIFEARRKPMDAHARSTAPGDFASLSQGTHPLPVARPDARAGGGLCAWADHTILRLARAGAWAGHLRLSGADLRPLRPGLFGPGTGASGPGIFPATTERPAGGSADQGRHHPAGLFHGRGIATAFVATHPGRIRQLVLLASAGMEVKADRLTRFITRTPMIGDWLMLALFPRRHRTGTNAERALPGSVENIVERQQNELRFKGFIAAILASMRGILSTPRRGTSTRSFTGQEFRFWQSGGARMRLLR